MMRLARRILLLVVLSLLASVATASAECAWLVWWTGTNIGGNWAILGAHPTLSECDRDLSTYLKSYKRDGWTVQGASGSGSHGFDAEKGGVAKVFECLPDTVDPRGPKGK